MPLDALGQSLYLGQTIDVVYPHSSYKGLRATIASFDENDGRNQTARLNFIPPLGTRVSLYCWKLRGIDADLALDEGL